VEEGCITSIIEQVTSKLAGDNLPSLESRCVFKEEASVKIKPIIDFPSDYMSI
jgi:hypothetical protein